jgi:hypothetical protein
MNNNKQPLKTAIFMHIMKTAGTSMVNCARQYYGNNNVMSHGDHIVGWSEFPLRDKFFDPGAAQGQFGHVPFISGHFGYDFAKPFMKERYSFTFLRDPVERIISLYYFCKTRDPNEFRIYRLTQEYTFEEFLTRGLSEPEIKACVWNNQTWQLAHGYGNSNGLGISSFSEEELFKLAVQHLGEFSYIGFAESFEEDQSRILKDLGISQAEEHSITNVTPGRPKARDLPRSTMALLEELTDLDRALYKEAWGRKESGSGI